MPDFEARIRQGQNALFRQLDRDFKKTSDALYKSYQSYLNNTNSLIDQMNELARQRGLTARELAQSEAAQKLQATLRDDLNRYTNIIDRNVRIQSTKAGIIGLRQGAKNIEFAGLGVGFNHPNPRMLVAITRRTESTSFQNSLAKFAPYHVDLVNNIMLVGAAQGKNPKTIARDIRRFVKTVPLADSERIVRTAQIWAARDGNIAVYRLNDDVVKGWIWSAALDDRTCESCIAQHGKHFSNSETLDDHYNGRCAPIPDVGLVGPIQTGEDWFNNLSEDRQRGILGPSKFAAWKDGAFEFGDLSKTFNDAVYGQMRRPATLIELVGHDMQTQYRQGKTNIVKTAPVFNTGFTDEFGNVEKPQPWFDQRITGNIEGAYNFGLSGEGRGKNKFDELSDNAKSNLSKQQIKAFNHYTGDGYEDFTNIFHDGKNPSSTMQRRIDLMDSAISNTALKEDTWLYRGANFPVDRLKVGESVQDKNFVSTTVNRGTAQLFVFDAEYNSNAPPALIRIKAKEGQAGFFAGSVSVNPYEQEVILPRDSKLVVTGILPSSDGKSFFVDMEIIS